VPVSVRFDFGRCVVVTFLAASRGEDTGSTHPGKNLFDRFFRSSGDTDGPRVARDFQFRQLAIEKVRIHVWMML